MAIFKNLRKAKREETQEKLSESKSSLFDSDVARMTLEFDDEPKHTIPPLTQDYSLTPSGLYPHEVLLLDAAGSFFIDQMEFPALWRQQYGILDMSESLLSLSQRGFLVAASLNATLESSNIQSLKAALRACALPLGGKKADLIARLTQEVSEPDLYDLFPKRNFALSYSGIRALDEAMYIPYLAKHPVAGLDIWALHRMVCLQPHRSYRDLVLDYMESHSKTLHAAGQFLEYRDLRFRMYQFWAEENRLKKAFPHLAETMYYDLSGAWHVGDFLSRYVSCQHFFPYEKSIAKIPTGSVRAMARLQPILGLSDEMLQALLGQFFKQYKTPFHLFTREECVQIVALELQENCDALSQIYKLAEDRFEV